MASQAPQEELIAVDFNTFRLEVLNDFRLASISRETSLLGRKEVLTGKAKFGIFGDGKELAQIALAKQFKDGDFRSGYYRDQTLMMAIDQLNVREYFSGLFGHTDEIIEPQSAGRQMGGHFSTRNLDENGNWKDLTKQKNSSADISPTAGQMPRLLGLAQASKIYREHPTLKDLEAFKKFSNGGNEVAFGTIGDASTSEGPFWETINAAGVLQVPMVMSVWDDGYGISVPREYQTTKGSISEALSGMQRTEDKAGYEIFVTKGWDYAHLCETYEKAVTLARTEHIPVLVHVKEVNQPQGHSTSGSHERYKNEERLKWESEFDCINKFREWILNFDADGQKLATEEELSEIAKETKAYVNEQKKEAWILFTQDLKNDLNQAAALLESVAADSSNAVFIRKEIEVLQKTMNPIRKDIFNTVRKVLCMVRTENSAAKSALISWLKQETANNYNRYSDYLYSNSESNALKVQLVAPTYDANNHQEDGRIVLRDNFRAIFKKYPEALIFGEDAGKIGGVNQSLEGLQEQFGQLRVSDVGIRECTIIGQGIGMAMRGLRPIAEIQYLDYLLYGIQIMSDDLATVQYRTKGGQKAPLIVSTRGHRLEGIWHSGSPMGMIINSIRGVHVCVPRNMTKAAGFYNTLMQADEPALVIEPLNGYRIKEAMPTNIGEFTTPLGIPEVVQEGNDLTIVSYGSTFNLCEAAAKTLAELGISVELIDVQTLLPFDINGMTAESLKKTNRLMIVDEDVSSGATAFLLDQILVKQGGYNYLDSAPVTLSAKDHRPAYGTDGDYFSKPSTDDIIEAAYAIMNEADPNAYPPIY
ncbi:thiamine pyrophosphate-dependent enzyme [Fluviicola sp.]|jgi:pyruvate/2-oxoglutarate/acetoin dehydrogenase E1 component/TPP-dependent pyruvate/acetoin dehydrogenase alpha subunit|uniref:alpha-ketoacid dehydrogenase subunit alpha/beta n=1 Tax=Fluviicola sp. TaxID=1917219 RepID=UPI002833A0B1|nr:thiamine pyrophosphate-dependent enzyme [Fluviicola sp.]MDR0803071.1 transketolase [Fluviicola sp.]